MGVLRDDRKRILAGGLHNLLIGDQIGIFQIRYSVLAGAEKLPAAAQAQVLLGDDEAVIGLRHHHHARFGNIIDFRGGDQDAVGLGPPPPHPSAQLMELAEAEALSMLDHHHRGGGHVDPHLDDGGGDEHVDAAALEIGHDRFFFRHFQSAVKQGQAVVGKYLFLQIVIGLGGRFKIEFLRRFHQGVNHIGLLARRQLLADEGIDPVEAVVGAPVGLDLLAPGRQLVDYRNVKVAIDGQGQGAGDRGGGQHQHMRMAALADQAGALHHPKAVLLIDHCNAQLVKIDRLLDQGMRAHHQVNLSGGNLLLQVLLLPLRHAADQQGQAQFLFG